VTKGFNPVNVSAELFVGGSNSIGPKSLVTTLTTGNAQIATVFFATQTEQPFKIGQEIIVAGVTPNGYNGTFTVLSVTENSVSYLNATTGAQTVAGTVSTAVAEINMSGFTDKKVVKGLDKYVTSTEGEGPPETGATTLGELIAFFVFNTVNNTGQFFSTAQDLTDGLPDIDD
jgi:hypothetical protein